MSTELKHNPVIKKLLMALFKYIDCDMRCTQNMGIDDFIGFRTLSEAFNEIGEKETAEKILKYGDAIDRDDLKKARDIAIDICVSNYNE